jgi:two-component sensor histidine kinase
MAKGGCHAACLPRSCLPSSQRWPVVDLEREKLLLTETHHRIKNHLQIISSLLNMQINGVSDQDARNALRSSQNRVRAIAALHQHLYQVALGKGTPSVTSPVISSQHLRECYEVHGGPDQRAVGNPGGPHRARMAHAARPHAQ